MFFSVAPTEKPHLLNPRYPLFINFFYLGGNCCWRRLIIVKKCKLDYYLRFFNDRWSQKRRAGRAVEGARLESVYTATYQGFESLALRHITN